MVQYQSDTLPCVFTEVENTVSCESDVGKAFLQFMVESGRSWVDVATKYCRGEIDEAKLREFARSWGEAQSLSNDAAIAICREAADQHPEAVSKFRDRWRDWVQLSWCLAEQTGHAYFILAPHSLSVKIGYTGNPCAQRLLQLQTGTPEPLLLIGYMPASEQYTELFLHEHFRHLRIRGEWFQFDKSVAEFIRSTCSKRAPDVTLDAIPEFTKEKWNCDPWPPSLPRTNREIEAWLSEPKLY